MYSIGRKEFENLPVRAETGRYVVSTKYLSTRRGNVVPVKDVFDGTAHSKLRNAHFNKKHNLNILRLRFSSAFQTLLYGAFLCFDWIKFSKIF